MQTDVFCGVYAASSAFAARLVSCLKCGVCGRGVGGSLDYGVKECVRYVVYLVI